MPREKRSWPTYVWIAARCCGLGLQYWILFRDGGSLLLRRLHLPYENVADPLRLPLMFGLGITNTVRDICWALFLERQTIPPSIALGGSAAIAANWAALSLVSLRSPQPISGPEAAGAGAFLLGSIAGFYSELQRYWWKQRPENKGRLHTTGLWSVARHINYTAEVIVYVGACLCTGNPLMLALPLGLFCQYLWFAVPAIEADLTVKYPAEFAAYCKCTSKLLPKLL